MNSDDPLNFPHKPVEDGFAFDVETDSLADTMGLRLPNRSLYVLQGIVGAGKSLIAQRLVHGMLDNGVKVLVVTTELTTRGWIEQMESIGYGVTDALREGRLMIFSRFGTVAEARVDVGLQEVLDSEAVAEADVVILDRPLNTADWAKDPPVIQMTVCGGEVTYDRSQRETSA